MTKLNTTGLMEKYKVIALYLLILVVLGGCKVKKNSETYVRERNEFSYALPSENTLVVENLCDTLNRPLETLKTISTGISETKVEIKGNRLVVETKTDTVYKDRVVEKIKTVTETKEVPYTPKWVKTLSYLMFVCLVLFVLFPGIPRAIQVMAKKLVGIPT